MKKIFFYILVLVITSTVFCQKGIVAYEHEYSYFSTRFGPDIDTHSVSHCFAFEAVQPVLDSLRRDKYNHPVVGYNYTIIIEEINPIIDSQIVLDSMYFRLKKVRQETYPAICGSMYYIPCFTDWNDTYWYPVLGDLWDNKSIKKILDSVFVAQSNIGEIEPLRRYMVTMERIPDTNDGQPVFRYIEIQSEECPKITPVWNRIKE